MLTAKDFRLTVYVDTAAAKMLVSIAFTGHGIVNNLSFGNVGNGISGRQSTLDKDTAATCSGLVAADGSAGHV